MSVHLIRLDDRDPSIIYSNATWASAGNGYEYMRTTSRSNRVGAYMRIPFNGTKIAIYGTIDSSTIGTLPQSLITIDDARGFIFLADQTAEVQYQQKFWESGNLPPGPHLLTVNIISGSSMKAAFTFDYVEYYPVDLNSNLTSASTSSSTSTSTPSSVSSTSNASGSGHKKSSTPVIVGAIVGVVALLSIVIGVMFWVRRRRMRGMNTIPSAFGRRSPSHNERSITPFITHSRNPSNAFTSSNHDLNNSSSMSEYLSSRAAAQTPSIRNGVSSSQKSSSGGASSSQQTTGQVNNTPLSPGEERRNPPPRYESYRFPRAPPAQTTNS
uniref:Transmembrane protein n=1 Tax=Psilocybe cubensis TaxID=181762 RepID=A0A8H7Y6D2_PSICU